LQATKRGHGAGDTAPSITEHRDIIAPFIRFIILTIRLIVTTKAKKFKQSNDFAYNNIKSQLNQIPRLSSTKERSSSPPPTSHPQMEEE
jgi:hypothetical protein